MLQHLFNTKINENSVRLTISANKPATFSLDHKLATNKVNQAPNTTKTHKSAHPVLIKSTR